MGDPRKSKKTFNRPTRPYDKERITAEKETVKQYGLRRKNEIYKAENTIRIIKRRARECIATKNDDLEKVLLQKVSKLKILGDKEASIDAILTLGAKAVLDRRLETLVVKNELANSHLQARQFITHGHIFVGGIKVTSPKYHVCVGEDELISYNPRSSLVSTFKHGPKKIKEPRVFEGRRFGGRGGRRPFRPGQGRPGQGRPGQGRPGQGRPGSAPGTGSAPAGATTGGVKK